MTTFVLDDQSETTTLAEVLRTATDRVIEIRRQDGRLVATLQLAGDDEKFDYAPHMPEAKAAVERYLRRGADQKPGLTTKEFLDALGQVDADE